MHPLHVPPKSAPAVAPSLQNRLFFPSYLEERSSVRHARRGKAPSPSRVSSAPRSLHASLSSPEKCEKLTPVLQATPPAPKLSSSRAYIFQEMVRWGSHGENSVTKNTLSLLFEISTEISFFSVQVLFARSLPGRRRFFLGRRGKFRGRAHTRFSFARYIKLNQKNQPAPATQTVRPLPRTQTSLF